MATVLVTGANRGIGLGLAKEFLKRKEVKTLIATSRNPSTSKDLKAISDPRLQLVELDVARDESIKAAANKVSTIIGASGLALLVNNSGVLNPYPVEGPIDRKPLTQQFDVNSIGPLVTFQAFLPLLRKASSVTGHAKVINIGAFLGSIQLSSGATDGHFLPYKMSKTAVNMLTKVLAQDFAKDNIYVYAVDPGWVQTDMGSSAARLTVEQSANALVASFYKLTKEQSGGFFSRDLKPYPY